MVLRQKFVPLGFQKVLKKFIIYQLIVLNEHVAAISVVNCRWVGTEWMLFVVGLFIIDILGFYVRLPEYFLVTTKCIVL